MKNLFFLHVTPEVPLRNVAVMNRTDEKIDQYLEGISFGVSVGADGTVSPQP